MLRVLTLFYLREWLGNVFTTLLKLTLKKLKLRSLTKLIDVLKEIEKFSFNDVLKEIEKFSFNNFKRRTLTLSERQQNLYYACL